MKTKQSLSSLIEALASNTQCNWAALERAMKVLEGPTDLPPLTKRICYAVKGVNLEKSHKIVNEVDVSRLIVRENVADNVIHDKKCDCSIQQLWRDGCVCGGV